MHTFDVDVNVILVRSHSRNIQVRPDHYKRFVDQAASFDYLKYGCNATKAKNGSFPKASVFHIQSNLGNSITPKIIAFFEADENPLICH